MESIREAYETLGVEGFYKQHGSSYTNPHEASIKEVLDASISFWNPDLTNVLDLACGDGVITRNLKATNVVGIDPYTNEAYLSKTGKQALTYTFDDISNGAISDHRYSLIICSYALHLVEQSKLRKLEYMLALISKYMLIISPHKNPTIVNGWTLKPYDLYLERIRAKYYESQVFLN